MALDEDLRTEIIAASTTLGTRVHQNIVPEHQGNTFPRCWFQRISQEDLLAVDGSRIDLKRTEYTVEFISEDIDEAIAAANAVAEHTDQGGLLAKRGTFGAGTVQGVFITDQDDDYQPRGIGADEGAHVSALAITIWST